MTTRREVKIALVSEFLDNFDTTIPISLDNNDEFVLASGTITEKPSDSTWVRFMVQNTSTDQISYGSEGNRKFGRFGVVSCQVFIPSGTGTDVGDALCEDIVEIFEGKRFTDIYCYQGVYTEMGIQEDGFYGFKITIFWDLDEQK